MEVGCVPAAMQRIGNEANVTATQQPGLSLQHGSVDQRGHSPPFLCDQRAVIRF